MNSFRDRYVATFAKIGHVLADADAFAESDMVAAEVRLDVRFPEALRSYYRCAGRHKVNQAMNRLLCPEKLHILAGKLVFLEENQLVSYWGIDASESSTDPFVWQGVNGRKIGWFSEEKRVSDFLELMVYWQAVNGGLEHVGTGAATDETIHRIANGWAKLGEHDGLRIFGTAGQIICVTGRDGESRGVCAGARTDADFRVIETVIGCRWDHCSRDG